MPGARAGEASAVPAAKNKAFTYTHEQDTEVPWSIFVCKIERTNDSFEFCTTLGNVTTLGMTTVSEQVKKLPPELGQPVAAINGDFFGKDEPYEGDPRDLQIRFGELVSGPTGHSCFWLDAQGQPQMTNVTSRFKVTLPGGASLPFELNSPRPKDGVVLYTQVIGSSTRTSGGLEMVLEGADKNWLPLQVGKTYQARVRSIKGNGNSPVASGTMILSAGPKIQDRFKAIGVGSVLQISTETFPQISGSTMALGGGPALIREGKAMEWTGSGIQPRHPRAALGWNKDHYFMVEVDGRQADSAGMTLPELAEYMLKLHCEYALNLDGGGSATMWVLGSVMNSPSEGQERPAANALVLLKKGKRLQEPGVSVSSNGSESQSK